VEVPHTLFRGAMIPGLCGTGLRLNDDGVSTTAGSSSHYGARRDGSFHRQEDEGARIYNRAVNDLVRLQELMELERERNKAKNRYHHLARSLSGISPGMGNSLRSSAWPADPPGTSISSHCHSDCRSGCRCRMWLIISSTASMVPGMTNSKGRYTRSRMREFQG
jgi:hypothetical protein